VSTRKSIILTAYFLARDQSFGGFAAWAKAPGREDPRDPTLAILQVDPIDAAIETTKVDAADAVAPL